MKLTIYYLIKTLMVALYFATIVYMFNYSLMPLFVLYGFWSFIGTITAATLIGALAVAIFWALPKPKKPQATPRDLDINITSHPNLQQNQEHHFNSIKEHTS